MAKGWEIEAIKPDQPLKERARLIIVARFQEAISFRDSICASEEPELIHKMRVALRRLWAAMTGFDNFFSDDPAYQRLARRTRRLAKRLGGVRDLDVLIEILQKQLTKDPHNEAAAIAIDYNISYCFKRREKSRIKLLKYFQKLDQQGFNESFLSFFSIPSVDAPETLGQGAEIFIAALDNFFAHALPSGSTDSEALHNLRIAAKRLRYSLEIFEACYQHSLSQPIKQIRALQELLGDIHDCDVMMELLAKQQAKSSAQSALQYQAGLTSLIATFQTERKRMAAEFDACWQERFQNGFRVKLQSNLLNNA